LTCRHNSNPPTILLYKIDKRKYLALQNSIAKTILQNKIANDIFSKCLQEFHYSFSK